jgi:hypothetical protein
MAVPTCLRISESLRVCDTHCLAYDLAAFIYCGVQTQEWRFVTLASTDMKRWSLILWMDVRKRFDRYCLTAWQ